MKNTFLIIAAAAILAAIIYISRKKAPATTTAASDKKPLPAEPAPQKPVIVTNTVYKYRPYNFNVDPATYNSNRNPVISN